VPSKRIPDLVNKLTSQYAAERQGEETFQQWAQRIGKKQLKIIVDEFTKVPPHAENPDFYSDWGDPRQYGIGDIAVGECAGEIVSLSQFGFSQSEAEAFEAQLALDAGNYKEADEKSYTAMLRSAHALVQLQLLDVPFDPATIINEFRTRFVDTKIFWDTYHGDQFSRYLFVRYENGPDTRYTVDTAHKIIEEANLFIDAAHKAHAKFQESMTAVKV
jgi:sulfite reductase (ferredoxin)